MTDDGVRVLAVPAEGAPIGEESAALDVIGDAFGVDAQVVSIPVARLTPEFFRLRSGVAGAVTAKFVNYRLRLVVVGDPSHHGPPTGPVEDWMREANRGRELWFVADDAELERRLASDG
jgi:Domain of unknown function (DUF4180)